MNKTAVQLFYIDYNLAALSINFIFGILRNSSAENVIGNRIDPHLLNYLKQLLCKRK